MLYNIQIFFWDIYLDLCQSLAACGDNKTGRSHNVSLLNEEVKMLQYWYSFLEKLWVTTDQLNDLKNDPVLSPTHEGSI